MAKTVREILRDEIIELNRLVKEKTQEWRKMPLDEEPSD